MAITDSNAQIPACRTLGAAGDITTKAQIFRCFHFLVAGWALNAIETMYQVAHRHNNRETKENRQAPSYGIKSIL